MNHETTRRLADTGAAVPEKSQPLRVPHILTLPPEQCDEIILRHAAKAGIKNCELCGKRLSYSQGMTVAWQVDAKNNPDTLYIYRIHTRCFLRARADPEQRDLVAIETRASREFAEYLGALPTVGGTQ